MNIASIGYEEFIARNSGFVPLEVQQAIRKTRVLVAGCGIGSTIAEALVRVGFEHMTLIDGDSIEAHNLNRQDFTAADVGKPKAEALARRLSAIYPSASIHAYKEWLNIQNASRLVAEADFVFDTIDFLSLEGIVALHDACRAHQKPVISALSAGWGAMAIYFPSGGACSFRQMFGIPQEGLVNDLSYVEKFTQVLGRIKGHLSAEVLEAMGKALTIMADGKPCPASQVSAGSWAVAALAVTMIVRILRGQPVTTAPRMLSLNIAETCLSSGIDLGDIH